MLGLFGTLGLGTRSLQTQRTGVEVAGQNLANVSNPDYARQRVAIQTAVTVGSPIGPQGTGADAVAIRQIRDAILDSQITTELSVGGYLDAQQRALQHAQSSLGEVIDRNTDSASGGQPGLADDLNRLFAAFQSVSTSPSSLTERQLLLSTAQDLATRFNQASERLATLNKGLNTSLASDVNGANQLLADIANLNDLVVNAELSSGGVANDLRDLRQAKLEQLSKLVKVDAVTTSNGALNISVNGNLLIADRNVLDRFQVIDPGDGKPLPGLASTGAALSLSGGHMQGLIDVRDGALANLGSALDTVAATLIAETNAAHAGGFALNGATGANFFNGTDARSISVNSALLADPSLVQLSSSAGSNGNNQIALALAQIATKPLPSLGGHTISEQHHANVAALGNSLASVNDHVDDHRVVSKMLSTQRSSISGVSIDEEMTDLIKFQKAFEASAKLISTVNEMLETVVNLKR